MGRNFEDPGLQTAIEGLPYDVVNVSGKPTIKIDVNGLSTLYTPEDISVMVLEQLRSMAEIHLNTTNPLHSIIAIPSYFSLHQRETTKEAAEAAGFVVERLIHESTAIAIAYRLDQTPCDEAQLRKDCTYLLYDIHENQYDLSLLNIDHGMFEVIEASENENIGWEGFDISHDTCESRLQAFNDQSPQQILESVQKLLEKAKFEKNEIDGIVVSGDSLYLSEIRGILEDYFPGKKALSSSSFANTQAIVYGAAVQGGVLSETLGWDGRYYWDYIDTALLSIGIETSTGAFLQLIPNYYVIPTRKRITLTTSSDHQEKAVIRIFCGQREIASKNELLGTLELSINSHAPKGELDIELTIEVDPNAVLKATASIQGGSKADFVVPITYTYEDIDRIVEEGKEFRDEDLRELEETQASMLYGVEVKEPEIKEHGTLPESTGALWKWLFGWI